MIEAARALQARNFARAEHLARSRLAEDPEDIEAMRLLAGAAVETGKPGDAERLLRHSIENAPNFVQAHADLCALLCKQGRGEEALALLDEIWKRDPASLWALSLKTAVLDGEHRTSEALPVHEALIARASHAAIPWINYGQALVTVGRAGDAIAAYRKSLALDPANGHAWWGLANLRAISFTPDEVAAMQRALHAGRDDLGRVQLHYALGKGLGDQEQFEQSFRHYKAANELRGRLVAYDADAMRIAVRRMQEVFTTDLLASRSSHGSDAPDAIFIVGLPRSGSTLIEQILASHPQVEALGELMDLRAIVSSIGSFDSPAGWINAVAELDAGEIQAIGENYLASVRRYRRTDRPFFTDKMPANWQYAGLIQLVFPNAKVIDVRRHPAACCFSAFTTYFNARTSFPTDLADLGRYYRDYVRTMDHFAALRPARFLQVQYERVVDDLEGEVRRLLAQLGLPFEENCLRFHETPRAVRTPSAVQVRRPINRDGLERWRNYEPWLGSLKAALDQ